MKKWICALLLVSSSPAFALQLGECSNPEGTTYYQIDHIFGEYLQINHWAHGRRVDVKWVPLTKKTAEGYEAGAYAITLTGVTLNGVQIAHCKPSSNHFPVPRLPPDQGSFW